MAILGRSLPTPAGSTCWSRRSAPPISLDSRLARGVGRGSGGGGQADPPAVHRGAQARNPAGDWPVLRARQGRAASTAIERSWPRRGVAAPLPAQSGPESVSLLFETLRGGLDLNVHAELLPTTDQTVLVAFLVMGIEVLRPRILVFHTAREHVARSLPVCVLSHDDRLFRAAPHAPCPGHTGHGISSPWNAPRPMQPARARSFLAMYSPCRSPWLCVYRRSRGCRDRAGRMRRTVRAWGTATCPCRSPPRLLRRICASPPRSSAGVQWRPLMGAPPPRSAGPIPRCVSSDGRSCRDAP